MPALDKLNSGLAFTYAAVADKQTTFAVHLNQNAVARNSGSQLAVQK